MLITLPQIPNIFLPLISGIIIDNIGPRWGLFVFTFVVFIGSIFQTLGGYYQSYAFMMIGAFIKNYGEESGCMSNCTILNKWLKGKLLAFVLAIANTNIRFYEIAASWFS